MSSILRRSVLVALVAVLLLPVFLTIHPKTAQAAPYSADDPSIQAKAWVVQRAMAHCFTLSESGIINEGDWFYGNKLDMGDYAARIADGESKWDYDDETTCNRLIQKGVSLGGWSSEEDALCSMGVWKREHGNNKTDYESCKSGSGNYQTSKTEHERKDAWNEAWRAKYLQGKLTITESLKDEVLYFIMQESFVADCGDGEGRGIDDSQPYVDQEWINDPRAYKIAWWNGSEIADTFILTDDEAKYRDVNVGGYGIIPGTEHDGEKYLMTCIKLATTMNRTSTAVADYVEDPINGDRLPSSSADDGAASVPTCESNAGKLSWLLCSVLEGLDGSLRFLDNQVSGLLFIESDVYNSPDITSAWKVIRNIAFIILIPMMLLMVIGTALEFGPFDAYTVKKALPRMVVAVIFIALSLPITQFGVQTSNTVGNGIGNLIVSTVPEKNRIDSLESIFAKNESSTGDSWFTGIAAATTLAAGGAVGFTLVLFAATAALALLTGFVVLVMRQVLILLLIVIAPLAILVWIFPGNDKLWTVWKTTFIAMLMMYPLIAILIASGKFVAGIAG